MDDTYILSTLQLVGPRIPDRSNQTTLYWFQGNSYNSEFLFGYPYGILWVSIHVTFTFTALEKVSAFAAFAEFSNYKLSTKDYIWKSGSQVVRRKVELAFAAPWTHETRCVGKA